MPVLPLVGSRIVEPGCSDPSFSAASIIAIAARSLIEPVGLRSSSLAHSRTSGDGDSRGSPTSGVPPSESSSESNRIASASSDGREDRHRVAVAELGLEAAEEPDVLVVEVDVDEPAQRTLVVDQPATQPGVLAGEVVQQRLEGVALALDLLLVGGQWAQDGRDADLNGHGERSP